MSSMPHQDEIYDAELTKIDMLTGFATFRAVDTNHSVKPTHHPYWNVGTIGRLRLASQEGTYRFFPYPDQRLRRHRSNDDLRLGLRGWRIDQVTFECKAGVIPGKDGLVVIQDTETALLELPREYLDLCRLKRLRPETVLQGFVADLCSLINWVNCPREDSYCSNGSDERRLAREYFSRAYGWLSDAE